MVHFKIAKLQKIPQHEQRSPEWFAQRYKKLTSSDAATVLGINPYSKPHELLFKKCGYDPKPFISNIATLHGQKYEDTAIELYCRITGKFNYNFGCICYTDVHKEFCNYDFRYDFLAGSPDGIAESIYNPDEEPILLEVKCPYRRPIKDGYIPEYYYPQVQLNLFICDLNIADFIEFCPKTNKLNIVRISKDYNWINKHVPLLINFWNQVVHYREIGIEYHEEYIKKKDKELERQKKKQKQQESKNQKITVLFEDFKNEDFKNEDKLVNLNNIQKRCIIIDE
jgi:putative phage-type endonuclease